MFDLIQTVLFVILLKYYGLSVALTPLIMMSVLNLIWHGIQKKNLPISKKVMDISVILFGTLSLFSQNPLIFQFKTTIVYGLTACVLLFLPWIYQKTLAEMMHATLFSSSLAYSIFNRWLIVICIAAALLNAYVVVFYSVEQWVIFKFILSLLVSFLIVLIAAWISTWKNEKSSP
jgi:intracellular septation protein A